MKTPLIIRLWGKEIGRLCWDQKRRNSYFTFHPDFLQEGLDIAPLSASINSPLSRYPIYGEDDPKFQKLPSFLADSLPDAWGNLLFEQWCADQKLPLSHITPLEKLSFIGRRAMGALEFEPEIGHSPIADDIDLRSLSSLAKKIFTQRSEVRILPEDSITLQALMMVGTSAGGRQAKAIIAIHPETGEIRSGQQDDLLGFRYYLLKFGDSQWPSAEIELTYYQMAKLAGINMMPSSLMEVEGIRHFLTERFDRSNDGEGHCFKHFTQTLAALYPEADSYERLLWVCRKLQLPEPEMKEVFRRLVFNWLANNTDDHSKNFSFIMDKDGRWHLSPAYDMTFIFNEGAHQPNRDHCLALHGKLADVTMEDILTFAKDNGIARPKAIVKEVYDALTGFRTLAEENHVPAAFIGIIETTITDNAVRWGLREPVHENLEILNPDTSQGLANVRLESTYKGNYHLLASHGSRELKYIIRKGTEDHLRISLVGISGISAEMLNELAKKYLEPKI